MNTAALDEDGVNKDVGRNTLVTVAGCSVQYLLPPGDGKAAEYMHRVQAALYDLLYAHSGLGPVPASLVASTFAPASRPRTIVGISVVSQAASRTGRVEGAALAVAMKVDVATGRVYGRIGSLRDGRFNTGKFQALSRTLVDVASAGLTSLGEKQQDRKTNFISFIRGVVDEIASEDPNALVLLESTTSRSLWSWLSDENISPEIYLEDHAARPPSSWKSLRLVRVRERSAGRVGRRKAAELDSRHAAGRAEASCCRRGDLRDRDRAARREPARRKRSGEALSLRAWLRYPQSRRPRAVGVSSETRFQQGGRQDTERFEVRQQGPIESRRQPAMGSAVTSPDHARDYCVAVPTRRRRGCDRDTRGVSPQWIFAHRRRNVPAISVVLQVKDPRLHGSIWDREGCRGSRSGDWRRRSRSVR